MPAPNRGTVVGDATAVAVVARLEKDGGEQNDAIVAESVHGPKSTSYILTP